MLTITTQKIYIYRNPVNLHRSFEGLCGLVENAFSGKLLTGSLFVFLNRRRNKLKLLYWDSDGLAIWYKRLEKGTFRIDRNWKTELTRREFLMLLEGIKPKRLNDRFSL
jgi:transposase